jgi:hypothetical protein
MHPVTWRALYPGHYQLGRLCAQLAGACVSAGEQLASAAEAAAAVGYLEHHVRDAGGVAVGSNAAYATVLAGAAVWAAGAATAEGGRMVGPER